MALTGFSVEEMGFFFIIFIAIMAFSSSNWDTGANFLIWGPALLLSVPFHIASSIAGSTPILAPLAVMGLFLYLQASGNFWGHGTWAWVVMAVIIVALSV